MAPNRVEVMMWMRTVIQRWGTWPVAIWMAAVENNANANAQLEPPVTCSTMMVRQSEKEKDKGREGEVAEARVRKKNDSNWRRTRTDEHMAIKRTYKGSK